MPKKKITDTGNPTPKSTGKQRKLKFSSLPSNGSNSSSDDSQSQISSGSDWMKDLDKEIDLMENEQGSDDNQNVDIKEPYMNNVEKEPKTNGR